MKMRERHPQFDLNSTQDFYAEGRIDYARQLYDEGMAAIKAKDFKAALIKLRLSAKAFPSPKTLRQIGECLLDLGRPADATLYLAAAVGMVPHGMHIKPLLLLIKALLRSREIDHALLRLQEVAKQYPQAATAISTNPEAAIEKLLQELP